MRRLRFVLIACAAGGALSCSLLVDTGGLSGSGSPGVLGPDGAANTSDGGSNDGSAVRCPDGPIDPSLVLYLPLDEGTGTTAMDCSGHGNSGVIVGAGPQSRVPGHTGGALSFDGSRTCIALGMPKDLVLGGAFTVAAWVLVESYAQSNATSRSILAKTTATTKNGWRVVTDDPNVLGLKLGTANNTFSVLSPAQEPIGQWLHMAVVWVPGNRGEVYVGGALVGSSTTVPASIIEDPAASVFAGCQKIGSDHLAGSLDELRVYARALTAAEILALAR